MFFFFNDTATTEIYTLSLHDALPISTRAHASGVKPITRSKFAASSPILEFFIGVKSTMRDSRALASRTPRRSEEHTSELQSRQYLVCRFLLEKKKSDSSPYFF